MTTICIDIKALICPLPRSLFLLLSPVTGSMSPGSTSQILARKKRRGVSLRQSSSVFPPLVQEQTKYIIHIWSRYKVSSVNACHFQNSLQHDPLRSMHFYNLSPLVWLWFVFSYLTCYFFQKLILRMLRLGLGHKNNPVSKCFPLWIVVLSLNSSDNWEEAQGQDQPQSVRAQETRTQCLRETGKTIGLNATGSVLLYILRRMSLIYKLIG